MFKVATSNLSEDYRNAHPNFGVRPLGLVSAKEVREILKAFSQVDPAQNHDAAPHVALSTDAGNFLVRTSASRLFLSDLSNTSAGATELSADDIIRHLATRVSDGDSPASNPESSVSRRHRGVQPWIALAMLAAGLLLNGYTLYSAFYVDSVNLAPSLTPITDRNEYARIRNSLAGTFATGSHSGDRGIVLSHDGSAQLLLYGDQGTIRSAIACTYTLGRRNHRLYVNLKPRGQIEVSNPDLLFLFGDTYTRIR